MPWVSEERVLHLRPLNGPSLLHFWGSGWRRETGVALITA